VIYTIEEIVVATRSGRLDAWIVRAATAADARAVFGSSSRER
jgi:hypothetical protein